MPLDSCAHILTLIAGPTGVLDDSMARRVRQALGDLGAETSPPDWLAGSVACDIGFDGMNDDQAQCAARMALEGLAVDAIAQPAAGRRKQLLVADMESTIIEQEMLDELGERVGLRDRIAAITARAMNGEIDFKGALRERVALLAGLPATVLEEMKDRIVPMPGAAILVATLKRHGVECHLVSGGFKPFTAHVRDLLGFDGDQANDLEIADGKLTGRAIEPILDKDAKLQALIRLAAARGVPLGATLTVGDGANDLPMLLGAGLGVAFRAKPAVAASARARLDHADLTGLLYAQGYRADDLVRA